MLFLIICVPFLLEFRWDIELITFKKLGLEIMLYQSILQQKGLNLHKENHNITSKVKIVYTMHDSDYQTR